MRKPSVLARVLPILSFILFLCWFIGYIFLNKTGSFHLIFLVAVLLFVLKLTIDKKNGKLN